MSLTDLALERRVDDIYFRLSEFQGNVAPYITFRKLTIKEKLLYLNTEILSAAKKANITLPRG